jgi:hypothetical protein
MAAEELLALASAGGAALVGAVAKDAWDLAKRGVMRLFGRGDREREAAIEQRLDRTRAAVLAAGPDEERVRLEQQAAWTGRLEDLLTDRPEVADELRTLVQQVEAASGTRTAGHVVQHASATGNAQQAVQGHGSQVNIFGARPGQASDNG